MIRLRSEVRPVGSADAVRLHLLLGEPDGPGQAPIPGGRRSGVPVSGGCAGKGGAGGSAVSAEAAGAS